MPARFLHLLCTLVLVGLIWFPPPSALASSTPLDIPQRMEHIRDQLKTLRFCFNDSCFFRALNLTFVSPTEANLAVEIDRPAGAMVTDTADYHFQFFNNKWHLTAGEEYTDVADFAYKGNTYDIFSVHSNRVVSGNLDSLGQSSGLKSGYLAIYQKVLFRGVERD